MRSCNSVDAPARRAASMCSPSSAAWAESPASASATLNWSPTWRASDEAVLEAAARRLAAPAREVQPRVVDQRFHEAAVVAELAAELHGFAEPLLGPFQAPVDDVVEALLTERGRDAVRVAGLAVERERLVGHPARTLPVLGPFTRAREREHRVGEQRRIAQPAGERHGGVAQLARGGRVDQHRTPAERGQRVGHERGVAEVLRDGERLLERRLGLGELALRERELPVPVERGGAAHARPRVEVLQRLREPAAHLLRVRVPRQRAREGDRDPQRVLGLRRPAASARTRPAGCRARG